jgi:hypothetical protein
MSGFRRSRPVTHLVALSLVNAGRPLFRLNSRPGFTGAGLLTLASSFRRRREVIKRGLPRRNLRRVSPEFRRSAHPSRVIGPAAPGSPNPGDAASPVLDRAWRDGWRWSTALGGAEYP